MTPSNAIDLACSSLSVWTSYRILLCEVPVIMLTSASCAGLSVLRRTEKGLISDHLTMLLLAFIVSETCDPQQHANIESEHDCARSIFPPHQHHAVAAQYRVVTWNHAVALFRRKRHLRTDLRLLQTNPSGHDVVDVFIEHVVVHFESGRNVADACFKGWWCEKQILLPN